MAARTYVVVDGENLDATLGSTILKHAPRPPERPRWERVIEFAGGLWHQEVSGLFVINATHGTVPWSFVAALQNVGYRAVLLSGEAHEKVVDIGIARLLNALVERDADVLLGTHDRDFLPQVERLLETDHRVALIGFAEAMSGVYSELDVPIYDLEYDAKAFNLRLPRIRVIPLSEFDPAEFLD